MIDPELEKKNFIHVGQIWSPSLLQIHQRSGGERRNIKEVPRMEKQSYSRIGIFFFFFCKLQNVCTKIAVDLRSYSKIVKERFLPPPIADTHSTIIGLKQIQRDVDAHYLSLSGNLAFKAQIDVTAFKHFPKCVPYYYSCPAVEDVINKRLRSVCGLYLASIKELSSHEQVLKNPQTNKNDPAPPSEPR